MLKRAYFVLFPILFVIAPAAGQQPQIDSLASKILKRIDHSKAAPRTLLVCDFFGPDARLTDLGVKLADDLNASLGQSTAIQLADRSQITGLLHSVGVEREAGSMVGELAGSKLRIGGYVSGNFSLNSDKIKLSIFLYYVGQLGPIDSFEISLPITAEMKSLAATEITDTPQSSVPLAGRHGYSQARCIFCPSAEMSDFDVLHNIQGVVFVIAVVGIDGKLSDIRVVKGLPGDLDSSTVTTLKTWKLKPVLNPTGTAVPARQVIEVYFRVSN